MTESCHPGWDVRHVADAELLERLRRHIPVHVGEAPQVECRGQGGSDLGRRGGDLTQFPPERVGKHQREHEEAR